MCEELRETLTAHAGKYPAMEPQDGVKLVYQNEFGGGHLIRDPAQSLERLREEYAAVCRSSSAPLAEEIGNGMVRVMLSGLDPEEYSLETLNRDFVRSTQLHRGGMDGFRKKLDVLRELAGEGIFEFSAQELEEYLKSYLESGCPEVSHSDTYRAAFRSAYRVILRCVCLPLLVREVRAMSEKQDRVIVALDGRCASGKTTLSKKLAREQGWSVVHMDHFFLRPQQRNLARYAQLGGNIDHERFLEEVLLPLRRGERPVYRPFNCHTQTLEEPIPFDPGPVVLVEGAYACHPALWEHYDLRAFFTVNQRVQMERIIARDGPDYARVYRERWIPWEERYFSGCEIESRCDYQLEG